MNGYKNRETYDMSLWLHNDEYINNELLPSIFRVNNNCIYQAGEYLRKQFENKESFLWELPISKDIIEDVGSLWRVEWSELFEGLEEDES